MLIGFDGAKIHFFPDIPAVSAEILALRGWEREKGGRRRPRRGFRGRPPCNHGDRLAPMILVWSKIYINVIKAHMGLPPCDILRLLIVAYF